MFRKIITSVLAATIAVPIGLSAVPAYADDYDPNAPEVIALEQIPQTTAVASDPGTASNPSRCNQPFPASPVVICGYASFAPNAGAQPSAWGKRVTSGLPETNWTGASWTSMPWNSGWDSRKYSDWGSYKRTRDPSAPGAAIPTSFRSNINAATAGKTLDYYSSGIYWRDFRYWNVDHQTSRKVRSVTVPQGELVPEKKIEIGTKPNVFVITIPAYRKNPTPVTVYQTIVNDNIWGRSGSTDPRTFSNAGTYTYTEVTHYYNPFWISRTVSWGSKTYYPTPEIKQVWCQTELGPGEMTGPYDHDGGSLKSQIGINDSDLDPQTVERRWWTRPPASDAAKTKPGPNGGFILMSNIGVASENTPGVFVPGNSTAENLVINCIEDKPSYLASASNQPCKVLEPAHPLFGQELPASHELCNTFVPGNYLKNLGQSKEVLCTYTIRNWIGLDRQNLTGNYNSISLGRSTTAAERVSFVHCGIPADAESNPDRPSSPNSIFYPTTRAFWACAGDTPEKGNKTWHPDPTYDFLTCGQTFQCIVPSGDTRPLIREVASNTSTRSISQLLASGAQAEVSWDIPSEIRVIARNGSEVGRISPDLRNSWQTWTVIGNSAPWKFDVDPNDPSQSVFGNNQASSNPNNSVSLLNSGVNGWDSPNIYLRGYKGTTVADGRISVGDIVVNSGELIPFGIYTEYKSTIEKDTVVFGRPVTMNQPVTCTMDPAYLYYLSGRATG